MVPRSSCPLVLISIVIWFFDGALFFAAAEALELSISPLEAVGLAVAAAFLDAEVVVPDRVEPRARPGGHAIRREDAERRVAGTRLPVAELERFRSRAAE